MRLRASFRSRRVEKLSQINSVPRNGFMDQTGREHAAFPNGDGDGSDPIPIA
jgi:hypothetical protein